MSRRTAHSGPEVASPETGSSAPDWANDIASARGNSAAMEMITGDSMTEEEASFLLDGAAEEESEERVGDGPAVQPEAEAETETATPSTRPNGKLGRVYDTHKIDTVGMESQATSEHAWSIDFFKRTYAANSSRYASVAAQTGVPAKLIAALHFRESSMNFSTYLHQGDPLGKKAVNHPNNIPIFYEWEKAAVHALNQKSGTADALNMDETTTDPAALATYAERYNGLGYHNKGKPSPYVYSGTDVYEGGKYVRDGVYDASVWDRQPGVMALMGSVDGMETSDEFATPQTAEEAWQAVVDGHQFLRHGQRGPAVRALQEKLVEAGHRIGVDGHFGNGTRSALIAFQLAQGLEADGRVGPKTAAVLSSPGPAEEAPAEEAPSEEAPAEEAPAEEAAAAGTETLSAGEQLWRAVKDGGMLLKQGLRNEFVKELQKRLVEAGQRIIVDGDFGPATRRAVIAVQRALGLSPDGVVGPNTARKL